MTGNITVTGGDSNTKAASKNCHPFIKSEIHLNDEHVETADNLVFIMNMYNLIEYSDNYSDSSASLYHFKRQEPLPNNADFIVPVIYISNFVRSLQLPLINTNLYIQLDWTKNSIISNAAENTTFKTKTCSYSYFKN